MRHGFVVWDELNPVNYVLKYDDEKIRHINSLKNDGHFGPFLGPRSLFFILLKRI